mmetsp:Transcript_4656/g.5268  ORF Transcript_4656/g.5268 Transcript_4656/m.5268 type:complete len:188 (-) Transcript_4656:714-1277(-)
MKVTSSASFGLLRTLTKAPLFRPNARTVFATPNSEDNLVQAAVSTVIFKDETLEKIILMKREKPPNMHFWTFSGGSVDYGETIATATTREVKEELEIDIILPPNHVFHVADVLPTPGKPLSPHFNVICSVSYLSPDYREEIEKMDLSNGGSVLKVSELEELDNDKCIPDLKKLVRRAIQLHSIDYFQ